MAAIIPCPVCGRVPKIKHYDHSYASVVSVRCKPLFSKLHEEAIAYGQWPTSTYKEAIDLWNARVRNYKEVNNNANANN